MQFPFSFGNAKWLNNLKLRRRTRPEGPVANGGREWGVCAYIITYWTTKTKTKKSDGLFLPIKSLLAQLLFLNCTTLIKKRGGRREMNVWIPRIPPPQGDCNYCDLRGSAQQFFLKKEFNQVERSIGAPVSWNWERAKEEEEDSLTWS